MDINFIQGMLKRAMQYGLTEKQALEVLEKNGFIKAEGGKFYVHSEKGKKLSRGYKSKGEAVKRLQQIEYFKHKKG